MNTLCIKGEVFVGKGEGAKFVKLPWVRKQIVEKLGFDPYLGTLNLRLYEDGIKTKRQLKKAKPVSVSPVAGFCSGKCYKAFLTNSLECAIIMPEVARYPADVVEIVSSTNLREKLCLKDGDIVEVRVQI